MKLRKTKSQSGFRGVYRKNTKWEVKVRVNNKYQRFGVFEDKFLAGQVYDYHVIKIFGKNKSFLNFPNFTYDNWELPKVAKPIKSIKFRKLGYERATLLRKDYSNGNLPKKLSKKYSITLTAVYRVINNVTYKVKKTDVSLGGTSVVEMVYNPKTNTSIADSVLQL